VSFVVSWLVNVLLETDGLNDCTKTLGVAVVRYVEVQFKDTSDH
jgi:hypothetical protein